MHPTSDGLLYSLLMQNFLHKTVESLTNAGIETPSLDARLLLQHALNLTHEQLLLRDTPLTSNETAHFHSLIARRAAREPLAYITGKREFWGREFHVTPDTLIPRPDSETLIEATLHHAQPHPVRILDLGTGTGCLLLTLLGEYPYAHGVGVDISPQALAVARRNAECLGFETRSNWINQDFSAKLPGKYEIVVANPPYIPSNDMEGLMAEVVGHEPHLALDGGSDGLDCYRSLALSLPPLLTHGAIVTLEFGASQAAAVVDIFTAQGFMLLEIRCDLGGIERCVVLTHRQ